MERELLLEFQLNKIEIKDAKPFSLEKWAQYIFDNNWQLAMLFIRLHFLYARKRDGKISWKTL